jgi:hypothetical protein
MTQPTYPHSGQPGFSRAVPPSDGFEYTAPHARHMTLSSNVKTGTPSALPPTS